MRWFAFAGAIVLAASSVSADDPKPEQQDVAAIQKRITDLKALIAQKDVELAKAKGEAATIAAEGRKVREAAQTEIKELKALLEERLVAHAARAKEANAVALKAAAEEGTARVNLQKAEDKLKAATDPDEIVDLKKKVAGLEITLAEKKASAEKAKSVANTVTAEFAKAPLTYQMLLKDAVRDADTIIQKIIVKEAAANKAIAVILDERDRAELDLRKAQVQLEALVK